MLRNGQKMVKLIAEHLKQKNGTTGVYDADIVQFIFSIDDDNFNELIRVSKVKGK